MCGMHGQARTTVQLLDFVLMRRWHAVCKQIDRVRPEAPVQTVNQREGITMRRMIALALAATYVFIMGCNTVQGAGKDIERGGEKIQSEAQEHKKY